MEYKIKPLGETGLLVSFGEAISPEIHFQVKALADYLEQNPFCGMREYVISYTSVAIYYNPFVIRKNALPNKDKSALQIVIKLIKEYIQQAENLPKTAKHIVEIPVCYGGEYGPDIEYVAQYNHLTVAEVIDLHTKPEYLVYMIGFCPGFPYLGGMDKRLATPRRDTPRLSIPARSIGIAGNQTGGYPISTPGGWQIIGRTALDLFDPGQQDKPSLLTAGDYVKFVAIDEQEYLSLREGADK